MRSQAFWLAVIALALAAIAGGYVSGSATARVPAATGVRARSAISVHAVLHDPSDSSVRDLFSEDDVVVDRSARASSRWEAPQLAVVIGLCGESPQIEAAFMRLDVPLAVDVDPRAAQAASVAQLAREAGDAVFVHLDAAPTPGQLARLRSRFGAFDGVASRSSERFVQALDGTGLSFFDERGDADADEFRATAIPLAQRDVTVDDRSAQSYVRFMLGRAVLRSQHAGRLVVLMRPLAHSLAALQALASTRSVQFVALTQP
jgi:polysaccharide deacetylase 2 family uncharacterized protein YibQ